MTRPRTSLFFLLCCLESSCLGPVSPDPATGRELAFKDSRGAAESVAIHPDDQGSQDAIAVTTPRDELIGYLHQDTCAKPGEFEHWTIPFETVFGLNQVEVSRVKQTTQIIAQIEGAKIQLQGKTELDPALAASICQVDRGQTDSDRESLVAELGGWLRGLLPDCAQVLPSKAGWQCQFGSQVSVPSLAVSLRELNRTILSHWKRQPYIFSRRLALTTQLATILESPNFELELDAFCKVVVSALPDELPLPMASKNWQRNACAGPSFHRMHVTQVGLAKSVRELELIAHLIDKTTVSGMLQVRLHPRSEVGEELWVQLQPTAEVTSGILKLAQENAEAGKNPVCWHPLFDKQPKLLTLAGRIGLLETNPDATCLFDQQNSNTAEIDGSDDLRKYLVDLVMGETGFEIKNSGHGKVLMLPAGQYEYSIYSMPHFIQNWSPASIDLRAKGSVAWSPRRPNSVISETVNPSSLRM